MSKYLLIPLLALLYFNNCYCQVVSEKQGVTKKHMSLEDALKKVENDKLNNKKNACYTVGYDINLKPYIEITFLNKSSSKTVTTFRFDYEYKMSGIDYASSRTLYERIKPKTKAKFKLKLSDSECKSYTTPTDFEFQKLELKSIRYSDGSDVDYIIFDFEPK